MEKVFLVFEGDAWLSKNSLILMGVYDNIENAILDIIEQMSEDGELDGEKNRDDVAKELSCGHQTYGFDRNYIIKTASLNEWEEI